MKSVSKNKSNELLRCYKELARDEYYWQSSAPYIFPTILDMLKDLNNPLKILDIGCGKGHFFRFLKKANGLDFNYIGLDFLRDLIEQGREAYSRFNAAVADAKTLPFADDSFDVVIASESFEHMLSPEMAVKEFHRVLKKDGVLIISVPNYWNPLLFVYGVLNLRMKQRVERHLNPIAIKKYLGAYFKIIEERGGGYPYFIPSINTACLYFPFLKCIIRPKEEYKFTKPSSLGKFSPFNKIGFTIFIRCIPSK